MADAETLELLAQMAAKQQAHGSTAGAVTPEEMTRVTELLRTEPEFRKLFSEYAKAIESPEARLEIESYLSAQETAGSVPAGKRLVVPTAGFALEAHFAADGGRVYVNIVHDKSMGDAGVEPARGSGARFIVPHATGPVNYEHDLEELAAHKGNHAAVTQMVPTVDVCVPSHVMPLVSANPSLRETLARMALGAADARLVLTLGATGKSGAGSVVAAVKKQAEGVDAPLVLLRPDFRFLPSPSVVSTTGKPRVMMLAQEGGTSSGAAASPAAGATLKKFAASMGADTAAATPPATSAALPSRPVQPAPGAKVATVVKVTQPRGASAPVAPVAAVAAAAPPPDVSSGPAMVRPQHRIVEKGTFSFTDHHRGVQSLGALSTRPVHIEVRVSLPGVTSASQLNLSVGSNDDARHFSVTTEEAVTLPSEEAGGRVHYALELRLPFPVLPDEHKAKWVRDKAELLVLLRVAPPPPPQKLDVAPDACGAESSTVGDTLRLPGGEVSARSAPLVQEMSSVAGSTSASEGPVSVAPPHPSPAVASASHSHWVKHRVEATGASVSGGAAVAPVSAATATATATASDSAAPTASKSVAVDSSPVKTPPMSAPAPSSPASASGAASKPVRDATYRWRQTSAAISIIFDIGDVESSSVMLEWVAHGGGGETLARAPSASSPPPALASGVTITFDTRGAASARYRCSLGPFFSPVVPGGAQTRCTVGGDNVALVLTKGPSALVAWPTLTTPMNGPPSMAAPAAPPVSAATRAAANGPGAGASAAAVVPSPAPLEVLVAAEEETIYELAADGTFDTTRKRGAAAAASSAAASKAARAARAKMLFSLD